MYWGTDFSFRWSQTESGSPMCGVQLQGVGTTLGSCSLPLPGYDMAVLDADGNELPAERMGSIAIRMPLPPGFMTTLYNNDARYESAYLKEFPGYYSAGDAGFRDSNGYLHIMSRTDDIINVAAHRLSTGALEEVCSGHGEVVECAVVGTKDDIKGVIPIALLVCTESGNQFSKVLHIVTFYSKYTRALTFENLCLAAPVLGEAPPQEDFL